MARELSAKQRELVEAVKKRLQNKAWFKGVSQDDVPSDLEIEHAGFSKCVDSVVMKAEFWEAPSRFGAKSSRF